MKFKIKKSNGFWYLFYPDQDDALSFWWLCGSFDKAIKTLDLELKSRRDCAWAV